jgi:hypothetical protein
MNFQQQLAIFGILIVIFFVLREFWTWYWKISQMVELLQSIDLSLKALPAVQQMRRRAP